MWRRSLRLLSFAVASSYAFAWIGHFFVEHNRPATFKYPLKAAICDMIMYGKMWRGEMDDEIAKLGSVTEHLVARLVAGGLRTSIYAVDLGGFDTHSAQIVPGEPDAGPHARLLQKLSEAVTAFLDDLRLLGLEQRVNEHIREEIEADHETAA